MKTNSINSNSHDLSANIAKLNLELLIKTAEIAVATSKIHCEQAIGKVQFASFGNKINDLKNSAKSLAEFANQLAISADTLYYLIEAKNRVIVEIIK